MSNKISLEFSNKSLTNIDDSIELGDLQKIHGNFQGRGSYDVIGFNSEVEGYEELEELYGKMTFFDNGANLDLLKENIDTKAIAELINNYIGSGSIFEEGNLRGTELQEMIQTVYDYIAKNQAVFSSFKTYAELLKNAERFKVDNSITGFALRADSVSEYSEDGVAEAVEDVEEGSTTTSTTNSATTSGSTADSWLTNSNNVLIQLMLIILQIFNECLDSLAIRGSQLSEVQESLSAINDASVTFTQLAAAIAIAPEGVNSMHELFTVAGTVNNSGNLVYPELYGLVQPIASEMGMKIVIPTTPASGMSAGTVTAIDGTTTLSTDTVHSNVNDYFDDLNELVVSIGKEPIVFPDPSNVYGSSVKAVSDELNAAALYAGNISQNMMQEMKVLQDYLSIYMQAAANATTTNKEANQAVFR